MVNIKKQVIKTKIDSFLERNELVLFYHYNSINRKDWNIIKSEIHKATSVSLLISKNKIAQKAITFTTNSNKHVYPLDSSLTSRIKESSSALQSKALLTAGHSSAIHSEAVFPSTNENNKNLKKQVKTLFFHNEVVTGRGENSSLRGKAKQQNLQDSEVAKKK